MWLLVYVYVGMWMNERRRVSKEDIRDDDGKWKNENFNSLRFFLDNWWVWGEIIFCFLLVLSYINIIVYRVVWYWCGIVRWYSVLSKKKVFDEG